MTRIRSLLAVSAQDGWLHCGPVDIGARACAAGRAAPVEPRLKERLRRRRRFVRLPTGDAVIGRQFASEGHEREPMRHA